ncbi:MAG: hypothetical protein Q7S64_00250 [bacterium]|nr:hypothetical protein [bacterium]
MPIRMTTGLNRNRETLAEQGAGRISPSVIAVIVAVLALAVGVVVWLLQK